MNKMNKKSFIDSISDETLAKMIDRTLNFEKTKKTRSIKPNIIKIVSVAAALVIFIGLLNILPMIINFDDDNINPANSGENTDKTEINQSGLFIPDAIEKSFFEEKILNAVTNKSALNKILVYYMLKDSFYMLDSSISSREKNQLLDYLLEYTDITADEMTQMCIDNNISLPKTADPAYSHVRFGETEDILLLDIEWHTYDTYRDEYVEAYRKLFDEYRGSDEYINSSDEYKINFDRDAERDMKSLEEILNLFNDNDYYSARTINGKKRELSYSFDLGFIDISQYLDKDGYFIWNVYPYKDWLFYRDKDGIVQYKYFSVNEGDYYIYSKKEYDSLLETEIIPYCDDLLAKGLIAQEQYDIYTIKDPLDFFVGLWF